METKTILQMAALGAVVIGVTFIAKTTYNQIKKSKEEKSPFVGRLAKGNTYMTPKKDKSSNFDSGLITTRYATPQWTVGG